MAIRIFGVAHRVSRIALGWSLLIAVLAAHPPGAYGQQASAETASATAGTDALQEIIVTAERRATGSQTTPIAISTLSGDQLAAAQLNSVNALADAVPNFQVNNGGAFQSINIRGIGNSVVNPAIQTGIAVFRDGLFQPELIGISDPFYDTNDIEILRGPQGTFIGQASTGGAVLINSANPNFDGINGYIEASLGDYSDHKFTGAINLPISQTLAARIAFNSETRGSFYRDVGGLATSSSQSFVDPGNVNDQDVRVSVLWKPLDDFQALLKVESNRSDTDGIADQPNQNIPAYSPYYDFSTHSPYLINQDMLDQKYNLSINRNSLELKYTLPDGITLRSLSGFQRVNLLYSQDLDASSVNAQRIYNNAGPHDDYYSQEFNLLSPAEGKLTWIAGASWFYRDTPAHVESINAGFPFSVAAPQTQDVDTATVARTEGLFAQLSYQLTSSLQLQAGARENWDNNYNRGLVVVTNPLPSGTVVINVPNDGQYVKSTPTAKVDVNWTPLEGQFFYAFYARGYKAGATNGVGLPELNPEHVNDYEVGWKSKLLDGHLLTQLGGFYMNYQGMQQPVISPFNGRSLPTNLTSSRIDGIEFSAQSRLAGFGVDVALAYTASSLGRVNAIASYQLPDGGAGTLGPQCTVVVPGCFNYTPYTENLSGEQNPYSPKLTAHAGIDYGVPVRNATLRPALSYSYTGQQYASLFQQDDFYLIPSHEIWNGSLSYEAHPWLVQAYVDNFTNRVYISGYGPSFFNSLEAYGAPRQIGIRVRRSF